MIVQELLRPAIAFDTDTDTGIFRVAANTMGFSTAGVERVFSSVTVV